MVAGMPGRLPSGRPWRNQTKGMQQLVWQLGQQLGTGIVPEQEKSRTIQSFIKIFLYNYINRKFVSLQKFAGQDNWSAKNRLSRGKNSVFSLLCMEAEEYKR